MTSTRIFEIFLLSVLACGLFCAAPNASTSPEPVDEVLTEESDKELPNVYYGNYKIHHSENCDMNLNLHYGTRFDLEHLDMTIAFVKSNQKHKFNVKYSKNKKNGKLDNVEFGKPIKAGETQVRYFRSVALC
ncbi:hypothetical protein GCK72_026092 [Caenorhabditis remanei]|uniref:Uncharacterized protein n=1 Tax=Caenorhabditis remanei TaxID=31234 RepID=A0A6A5G4W8_CAERE|nr:hypothetical protein GCK72_026092 [Caenorhabditis remanei]KAF1749624.1 hypothetical protein GCK72_026092 [Caenorhabditis remanei]